MTAKQLERQKAIDQLRSWIKPGDTVYTVLRHVSRSGMQREIGVVLLSCDDGRQIDLHPNYSVGQALGMRQGKRDGLIIVSGCGMDMGFHLVYELSATIYPEYACLGKGTCPSNYHRNHHDQVRCPADCVRLRFHHPTATPITDQGYSGNTIVAAGSVLEHWPAPIGKFKDRSVLAPYAWIAVQIDRDADPSLPSTYQYCEQCTGTGSVPNPEGAERFDLTHTDGYALRQRWL